MPQALELPRNPGYTAGIITLKNKKAGPDNPAISLSFYDI
jgi:hypothetical protein